jgi:signal transduction histidine kinase
MVEEMHGRIWVDTARGEGSVFSVALPLASD